MNGYGSQCLTSPMVLRMIHAITSIVCQNRKRPVPRNRAIPSENRPKVSASYLAPICGVPRGTDRSARSPRRRGIRAMSASCLSPARRQQVIEDVVHRNRAKQAAVLVAYGDADQVIGGELGGQFTFGQIRPDEDAVVFDALTDQDRGRPPEQALESHAAQVTTGRCGRGRFTYIHLCGRGGRDAPAADAGQYLRDWRIRGDDDGL